MARLVAELRLEWQGLDGCITSMQTIAEAMDNACLDDVELVCTSEGFTFNGLLITTIKFDHGGNPILATVKPTASMILFIGWLMTQLPSTARVTWADGWPHVYCPPNDDRDHEDDPTPLVPNELVPA